MAQHGILLSGVRGMVCCFAYIEFGMTIGVHAMMMHGVIQRRG